MKLIHLTDTHLVSPGKKLYQLDPLDRIKSCIKSINEQHSDADLVVITGDLAHRGENSAYKALKKALEKLKIPVRLVIGNHDKRKKFIKNFPEEPLDENGFVQSSLVIGDNLLLFLDTVRKSSWYGEFCIYRQKWLAKQLESNVGKFVYLFMHHPPFPTHVHTLDTLPMIDEKKFFDVIKPYLTCIRHIFFGHIHRPIAGSWHGIPYTTLRGTNHQSWLDFRTVICSASHEPPEYCVIITNDTQVTVHYHQWMDSSKKFPFKYDSSVLSDIPKALFYFTEKATKFTKELAHIRRI